MGLNYSHGQAVLTQTREVSPGLVRKALKAIEEEEDVTDVEEEDK